MFSAYLSTSPVALIITWALQALSYSFLGRLTDVYQRDMLTETVEWQIGE